MTDKPNFRTVMRGYDAAEVDAHIDAITKELEAAKAEANEHAAEVTRLQSSSNRLHQDVAEERSRAAALEDELRNAQPTFEDLGKRVGQILSLAQAEADDLLNSAHSEAEQLTQETAAAVAQIRADAEAYAQDKASKADAEATKTIESARRQADEILDHADREATARREEAEAVYEHQRARAAAAAADFERTLAERRDKAAAEFAAQMQANDEALARAEELQLATANESDRLRTEAEAQVEAILKDANSEAAKVIDQARLAAERIRRESEREVQAATARRDAITAQLTNVRQMLATMGGAAMGGPSFAEALAEVAGEPQVEDAEEATDQLFSTEE
ncbi:MAG: DivIVA domain-containing protein [Propionibacteriaceae bacterium]|jgi:DivIVA domain-containing protein|nr:DivIVA domain-containing protein [Propionibacteriaceae bacterium]